MISVYLTDSTRNSIPEPGAIWNQEVEYRQQHDTAEYYRADADEEIPEYLPWIWAIPLMGYIS